MRPNPLDTLEKVAALLGRIVAIPFRLITLLLQRTYESLQAHPVRYRRASRLLAGGIMATVGLFITVTIVGNIALLQSMKMLGGQQWPLEQAILFIALGGVVGFFVGFGLLKMQPNLVRGTFAGIAAFALATAVVLLLRWSFGYEPFVAGTVFMLAAFPTAFASIWGLGGFAPQNMTIEANMAARQHPAPVTENLGLFDGVKFNHGLFSFIGNRIWPVIKPLVYPALAVTVAVGSIIAVLLVVGSIAPVKRVQTDVAEAAATTVAGTVDFLGLQLPKFVVFLIVAFIILGAIGTTALLIALIFNALSNGVSAAKKAAKQPLDLTEKGGRKGPFASIFQWVMRFIKFNIDFAADILNWVAGMFGARSAN